ncbi:MAG: lipoyl(octanoyl) transferase LipB [Candidatus Omnitrophota bacterium]|nr:lipoyl(octanoyl) transferase LipB [Candidatus Omnitrophota bacterium]
MILDLGIIDYTEALKMQRELVSKLRLGEISDSVMVVEHPSVFTIGRSGSRKNLLAKEDELAAKGIKVIDVDRGGDITFHSPGQLVVYPIIDLRKRIKDLHRYLRDMEEVAINFLQKYGVKGIRIDGATGVWVSDKKIASIGISAKDWVTCHGLSININNDTAFFSMINPCGIKGLKITSLKELLRQEVPLSSAKRILLDEFGKVFGIDEARTGYELYSAVA